VSQVFSRIGIKVVAATAVLIATSLTVGAVSAQAANKANGACATAGAVAKIGGKSYTCQVSPIADPASTKTTWVSAGCIAAGKSYTAAQAQATKVASLASTQVTALQGDITALTTTQGNIQAKITKYTTDVQTFLAKNPSKSNSKDVQTINNAINAMQTSLATTTKNITNYQAKLAAIQASQKTQNDQANAQAAKALTLASTICKSGL
jgi:prefoldin subunit 5